MITNVAALAPAVPAVNPTAMLHADPAWLVIYGDGLTQILNRREFTLFTVVVDKQRLVIDYGRRHGNRRFVLEASEG